MEPSTSNPTTPPAVEDPSEDNCAYHPPLYLTERFWLVSVVGTSVALVSVTLNLFLFVLLMRRKHRNSHCLYLLLLAFFDVFMGAAYIPLMSCSLLLDYLESVTLLRAWYSYMTPLITLSHVAMSASCFLILAASFERYCITCWVTRVRAVNKARGTIAAGAIICGFITKITLAGEFEIIFNAECVGTMSEYSLRLSNLAMDEDYNLLWRLGFRNVVTILLPFFLLLAMNLRIVLMLKKSGGITRIQAMMKETLSDVQKKRRVRAATRTLLLVVFTYLLANILNVLLTFWEYIDIESLNGQFVGLYTFGVDTVSILTILAGALRLPIYMTCMPQLRREAVHILKQIAFLERKTYKKPSIVSINPPTNVYSIMIFRCSDMLHKISRITAPSTSTTTGTNLSLGEEKDEHSGMSGGRWSPDYLDADAAKETMLALSHSKSKSSLRSDEEFL